MKSAMPPELLAPVGSPEALSGAIAAGADAVYLGTTLFNARMNAKNFDRSALLEALEKAHAAGVKVYVTMNTALLDRQIKDALIQTEFLYKSGVDALIVADLGFAKKVKELFCDLPLHASTQASGHSLAAAQFFHSLGFSRMVCARELSRENIKYLAANSPIPIEMFIHGAMCVSASGQCLLSSFIGGRSGNRGECAQPCRMRYNGRYPLSLKDMCLAGHICEILESGVRSLKIEGRMKSPEYVRGVVSVYRMLLDERRDAAEDEIKYLADLFSREGFTDGYYTKKLVDMNGTRENTEQRAPKGLPRSLQSFQKRDRQVRPQIEIKDRSASLPEGLFPQSFSKKSFTPTRSARWYNPSRMIESDFFDINYIPLDAFDKYFASGVLLPPVITDSELPLVKEKLRRAREAGASHALVGNVGHITLARELGFKLHGDFRLNITSNLDAEVFSDFEDIILSPELILAQIRDICAKKSIIVYGRQPLMVLERTCGTGKLVDRTAAEFPVIKEGGRELVLNCVPTYMADQKDRIERLMPVSEHFIFTVEGEQECRAIIQSYKKGYPTKKPIRRIKS